MLSDDGEVVKRYSPSDKSRPWWVGNFGRGYSENNYSGNNSNNSHSVSVKLDRKPESV